MKSLFALSALFLLPALSWSHPVTFEGGAAAFSTYRPKLVTSEVNYSLSPKIAVAATHTLFKHRDAGDLHFIMPRANFLLKRWNGDSSQANIYSSIGAGLRSVEGGPESLAGSFSLMADWESRRYYTELRALSKQSKGGKDLNHFRGRLGFAPYLAKFDELQTFLFGQASFTPEKTEKLNAGPVVRLFHKSYLAELGWDAVNDGAFVTLMIHY